MLPLSLTNASLCKHNLVLLDIRRFCYTQRWHLLAYNYCCTEATVPPPEEQLVFNYDLYYYLWLATVFTIRVSKRVNSRLSSKLVLSVGLVRFATATFLSPVNSIIQRLKPLIYKDCMNINLTVYNKIQAYDSSAQEMLRIRMWGFS